MRNITLSKKTLFPDSNFGIEDRNPQLDTPVHSHDFNEIGLVIDGTATHIIDGVKSRLKRGDIFIFRGNDSHGIYDAENLHLVNILFGREYFEMIKNEFKGLNGFNILFLLDPENPNGGKPNSVFHVTNQELDDFYSFSTKFKAETKYNLPWHESVLESLFKILIIMLCRSYSQVRTPTAEKALKIGAVIDYIHQNLSDEITLDRLAEKADMSVPAFRRLFKKISGRSPIDFLLRERIDAAALLLNNNKVLVQDVGKLVENE